ncbi:putative UDP-N-acetylglucosamine--peptide N-acetylglucosaminyltransferase SPINDLY [Platanthera guangdongensis]|uniref:Probable UDP-N-acetylglucosamine--peptide N-acetylglucosaminyltransferase SPINDLY n=1 Tax=Platanthera guangdongensis TaxID=2320717 RepID=A0ABR2LWT4_9ASPA
MKMAWPEVDVSIGNGRDGLISEIDCIKGIRSLSDAADNTPIPSHGLGSKFDRKSALAYANILRTRNKFGDALVLYNIVLEKESKNLEALVGKGICLQAQHLNRQAFESFMEVINLDSQNACALTHCGVLYKDEGRLLEAAESYQKALKVDPSYRLAAECLAVVLTDIGTSLKLAGNTEAGIQKYCEALNVDSRYAPAYYNLGVVYSEMLQFDLALSCYEKAAMERPMYAEAYCNMGVIYKNRGDLETAIACYERCLAVSPNFEISKNNMAIALTDLGTKVKIEGDISQGVELYKKALCYNWRYADAMYNLGVAYGELLKFDMAIVFYELALHFNPQCAEACNNLGVIYKDRDNLDKAVECYQMALSIKPNFSQSLNNLGVVFTVQGKIDAAAGMIEKAITANPSYAEAYNNLGVLYRDAGNINLAIEAYEKCLEIDPDSRNAGQNRLLAMNYINEGSDNKLFEAHREWGSRFMRQYQQYTSWDNPKLMERPLIIGYVSPDYFTHSVSYFIEAPLSYHEYSKYQVVVYSAVVKADAKTCKFKERVLKKGGLWRDIYGIDEKKVAKMVREDKVDILVELTGHTANNKLGTLSCRPAPIQVTWIGYPNTSGLPSVDYRISDSFADPDTTCQMQIEELVRLPECFLCYTPSPEAGPVCPTPALSNGFITFGSFNNLAKITPKVLEVWARILSAVPNSRLIVKCKPFCCDSIRQRFLLILEKQGVEPLRVDLLPLILLNHDHMQAYSLMDISLDTFPYAGTTTTCESLYMGVPCVTLAGSVHAHNVGVSLLNNVGLAHLVAKTEDEYVGMAVKLASDVSALSELRMSLRELMLKSPLCDGSKFTKQLESLYRSMWHRYCKGDVPAQRHMEALQKEQYAHSDKITVIFSKSVKTTNHLDEHEENHHLSTKDNGRYLAASSSLKHTSSVGANVNNGGLNSISKHH